MNDETAIEAERLKIEQKRLVLEETRTRIESKFFNRHFGAIIAAIVSIAAGLVSLTQIYLQHRQYVTQLNRESSARLKDQQLAEQRLLLDGVQVVAQHSEEFFGAPADRKEFIRNTALVGLPVPLGQVIAKAIDSPRSGGQPSAHVSGPPIELKSTGTIKAEVEIPPSVVPRLVLIQASARSTAASGGFMDLRISLDPGGECTKSSVYRNPGADPILVATATCFRELPPLIMPTKVTAEAPNRLAEALSVDLLAMLFDSRISEGKEKPPANPADQADRSAAAYRQ